VPNRAAQLAVRAALADAGVEVTPVIDRDYFWAIYFRAPAACSSRWRPMSQASPETRIPRISAKL
jgi:hypothetical protein